MSYNTFLSFSYLHFKNFFDRCFAFFFLILLSPFFLLISLLVFFNFGFPIFFIQSRIGFQCRPFNIIKFRTMNFAVDGNGDLLPDKFRLTPFGSFLRASSLDELPELINIIFGEMSFVGPRPLLVSYLPLYSEEQLHRHDVLPGLSGLAQINGRNDLSWNHRLCLDILYVKKQSFLLDFRILLITFWKVLRRDGINSKGSSSMYPFTGSSHLRKN